jgi:glycosyltransferase involved in cell wall biosynthesis
MGGTESAVVLLAEALARRGHDVSVFNDIAAPRREYGVSWWPLSEASGRAHNEIGIAVSNPKVFSSLQFRHRIFWLHNPLRSFAHVRRGTVWPLLKARPHYVLLGRYHAANVPRWLPSRGRTIIHHGVEESFFRKAPAASAPSPRAIFTSQPYRGLDWLLDIWGDIRRQVPGAVFDVFAPKAHQAAQNANRAGSAGVRFSGRVSRPDLARELAAARVQFIPGHRDETYCLAAAEATAAGVPIVTLGTGSLSERVRDGETGFIARGKDEFAARAAALLSDDVLWLRMHRACLAEAALTTWDARAEEWERLFLSLPR